MLLMPDNPVKTSTQTTTFVSKYAAVLELLLHVGDALIVVAAAYACYELRFGSFAMPSSYVSLLLTAVLFVLLIFPAFGLYRSWRGEGLAMEVGKLIGAWMCVQAMLVIYAWLVHSSGDYSRAWMLGWSGCVIPMLAVHRWAIRGLLSAARKRGVDTRKVVVVGATEAGLKIVNAARNHSWTGLDVTGYVSTPYDQVAIDRCPELGDFETFIESLRQSPPPDQIWVALPLRAEDLIRRLLEATDDVSTTVRLVPDMFGYELINHGATTLAGVPVITLRGSRIDGHASVLKAIEDRVLACIILLMISPVLIATALAVKLSSPGPVLYRQRRVGLDGKEFDMLKFRSMPVNNETGGVQWGNATKKTVTPIGRFIRSTSIDELPQFFNVLKGELSIVGPRPERPMFVEEFKKSIPGYMHKHLVKGGITGWAQINGWRGDTDLDKRIECDLYYINHWSIWLDLKIILLTPMAAFRGS
ncbi:MAG TPA: undecaprenyl-phosphate glucose phosphotransferase [Xanthomonadaceae bacterium]|jgi:Undecaprenyl-phosphate glucose phosphotransferase